MSNKITKKVVNEELASVNSVEDCNAILKAVNQQIKDNNKVVARNLRIIETLEETEELAINDLNNQISIMDNWNRSLETSKDKIFEKWDSFI